MQPATKVSKVIDLKVSTSVKSNNDKLLMWCGVNHIIIVMSILFYFIKYNNEMSVIIFFYKKLFIQLRC